MGNDAVVESKPILYTVGHSNHDLCDFLDMLGKHEVQVVADVRSVPYAKYCPQFNRDSIESSLESVGIRYEFLGRELGGRPEGPACYSDGCVDFARVAASKMFAEGLRRLLRLCSQSWVAVMCTEKDPMECHRGILICRELKNRGVVVRHILPDGSTEQQEQSERRLVTTLGIEPTLFDLKDAGPSLIDQAYDEQAMRLCSKSRVVTSRIENVGGLGKKDDQRVYNRLR